VSSKDASLRYASNKENDVIAPLPSRFLVIHWIPLINTQRIRSRSVGPHGESRRAEPKFWVFLWGNGNEFWGLRAKFCHGPCYHAKGGFHVYKHVILSSIVCLRAFPWSKTVLPPSHGSILCIIVEKVLKMSHFSKTGYRNMAETCVPDFLFDFYRVRGSIGTPSARSNGSRPRT